MEHHSLKWINLNSNYIFSYERNNWSVDFSYNNCFKINGCKLTFEYFL